MTLDQLDKGIQIGLMLGSRGCPFNCKFCDFKFNPLGEKRKWSSRSPESVLSEIKTIEAEVIGFADDIFTAEVDCTERACDLTLEGGIKFFKISSPNMGACALSTPGVIYHEHGLVAALGHVSA